MSDENDWKTGQVTLSINGVKFEMEMTVPAKPVKPTRMLPIFQAMTSSFVDMERQRSCRARRENFLQSRMRRVLPAGSSAG